MSLPPPPPPPPPPTPASAPTVCYRHPDRVTGRACTRCGRPACTDCLVQASVGSQCLECVREARPPVKERVRRNLAVRPMLVTSALIALNLAIYVVGLLAGGNDQQVRDWGIFGPAIDVKGEWWRIVTGGFVHGGLLHVAFNMYILFQLGRMLEPSMGVARYTLTYFAALLAGSAGALLVDPTAFTVGASGAVFGLLAAAVVGLWRRGVPIMQSNLGVLLVMNLVITFVIPGVSVGGHLGGVVAGAIVGLILFTPHQGHAPSWYLAVPVMVGAASFVLALWAAGRWML